MRFIRARVQLGPQYPLPVLSSIPSQSYRSQNSQRLVDGHQKQGDRAALNVSTAHDAFSPSLQALLRAFPWGL